MRNTVSTAQLDAIQRQGGSPYLAKPTLTTILQRLKISNHQTAARDLSCKSPNTGVAEPSQSRCSSLPMALPPTAIHRRSGISFRLRILTEQPHGMIDFVPRARSTRTVKPTTRRQYVAGDDDELLTIGEVAKLDGITAKALRYYDAHNILKPAAVDPATGYRLPATDYRYYTPDQMLDVDVMRICIAAGVPLDSLEKFRFEDGSLDWRALLAAAQSQVDERIQQLRRLQTSITDYSGELVRKAFSPEDGLVRADLLPTWLVARPCLYGNVCDIKRYLRIMTSLRTLIRDAQAPHLLRSGILLDLVECKAFAFQQFAPT